MANTPEVNDWLAKSNNLTNAAIALSGQVTITQDEAAMMRQVQSACMVLLTSLQRLPPAAPATGP